MINPIDSLAFNIQSNPGVYALLLGSGVSRSAQIPTGWEITLELIRKIAASKEVSADPDPAKWYQNNHKNEIPEYSKLINELGRTEQERQLLLRPFFEPNPHEHEENAKVPTEAHHAIAKLVSQGYIKVIVTTNFDRLIESALQDAGIEPTVISTSDQISGMLPLVHIKNCVIKVHGDYLDSRIRNTHDELSDYPDETNDLLDRIFEEFGLVVCGWSADWDIALRNAIFRITSRRFTTFWAAYRNPSDVAKQLIVHRNAQVINIESADSFFGELQQKVESIEQFSRPHPLSVEAAVTSYKRYLSEPQYRIQRSDLINETVRKVLESIETLAFDLYDPIQDSETITSRVRLYDEICTTLQSIAVIGGFWAENDHFDDWQRALEQIGMGLNVSGDSLWLGLQRYPGTVLLYSLGLGAVTHNRFEFLGKLLGTPIPMSNTESQKAVEMFPPFCMFENVDPRRPMQLLEGMENHKVPLNDWLNSKLRNCMTAIAPDDRKYQLMFDKLEILMALNYGYLTGQAGRSYWAPLGTFVYQNHNRMQIIKELRESITNLQSESPYVKYNIIGTTPEECTMNLNGFESFVSESSLRLM